MDKIKEICLGTLSVIVVIIGITITFTLNGGDFPTTMLPFDLDDVTIKYPELPDTISGEINVVINSVISVATMCFWIFTERGRWRKNKWLFAITLYFVFTGGVLVNLFTNFVKHYKGGLRPHFIAACHPDPTIVKALRDDGKSWVDLETTKVICLADGKPDYRWSFPSGHSSESFYGMVLSILIIQHISLNFKKDKWTPFVLPIKAAVQFAMLCFCTWITLSRLVDYHHNWWDVLAGALLGTLFAVVVMEWFVKPIMNHVKETDAESSSSSRFEVGDQRIELNSRPLYGDGVDIPNSE